MRRIKDFFVNLYKGLEAKHGKKGAIIVLVLGAILGLATPLAVVPGSTLIGAKIVSKTFSFIGGI